MANVRISDLPDAITPLDTTTTFFEVQAIENGVDVSRRVRGDMITFTVFPPPTIEGSVVRGNTTSMLYEETGLLIVSDATANSITIDGANNNVSTLSILNVNAPTGFDGVLQFRELSAPTARLFFDSSEGDFKVRINNPGIVRLEEGNGVVRLADFDSITGQQTLYAGTSGSDVPTMRTVLPASGGLEVDNQVTGAGFERVLTTSDAGGGVTVIAGTADGQTLDWNNGLSQWEPSLNLFTFTNGIAVRESASANTGIFIQESGGATISSIVTEVGNGNTIIDSRVNNGTITFQGRDSSANTDNLLVMTPESGVDGYFNNLLNWRGRQTGFEIQSTQAGATVLDFQDSGAVTTAQINSNAGLITIDGLTATAGFGLIIRTRDSGGTARILIRGNANNDVELYHAGTEVFRTVAAASGGAEANNTATGAGFERVLTTSDLGSSLPSGALNDMIYISTAPNTYSATSTLQLTPSGTNNVDLTLGNSDAGSDIIFAPANAQK